MNPTTMNTNETESYSARIRARRARFAEHISPQILQDLREQFQTDLPCFQTMNPDTGQYMAPDPIAAAIRDGQREVILWLQHEIALHHIQQHQHD